MPSNLHENFILAASSSFHCELESLYGDHSHHSSMSFCYQNTLGKNRVPVLKSVRGGCVRENKWRSGHEDRRSGHRYVFLRWVDFPFPTALPLHFCALHYIFPVAGLSLSHALPDLIESPFPAAGLSACPPLRAPPSTTAVDLLSYLHKLVHTAHTIA